MSTDCGHLLKRDAHNCTQRLLWCLSVSCFLQLLSLGAFSLT